MPKSLTYSTCVDVDVDVEIDEMIEMLRDEGYEVLKTKEEKVNIYGISRDDAKNMLNKIKNEYDGEIIELDYGKDKQMNIPAGSTVIILRSL